ncbi:class I SAM-dependent methyltransferase [Nocardiopsis sediminis]|uniref:Class I SAM-dependent methyltransferase n=1 Tax=Nocardiopsis sediminis TaxID=1778267 RepID=A0ABV8FQA7_9ACTN
MPLWWNHNSHYHDHLLRHVPPGCGRALDVGCGSGRFARRLAGRAAAVDAIDADEGMIRRAEATTPRRLNIRYTRTALDDAGIEPGAYDFISAIASIHHMPFAPALRTLAAGLAPGGVLAVVGLYREETPADLAVAAAALPPQVAIGAGMRVARALTGVADPSVPDLSAMPMRDPEIGLREIRTAAADTLPGARVRRLLFYRYSLTYTRPA